MAQHEAGTPAGGIEDLLHVIGYLPCGAGLSRRVAGGGMKAVAHEFVACDLAVLAVLLDLQTDEADR